MNIDDVCFTVRHFRISINGEMTETVYPRKEHAELSAPVPAEEDCIRIYECVSMTNSNGVFIDTKEWK